MEKVIKILKKYPSFPATTLLSSIMTKDNFNQLHKKYIFRIDGLYYATDGHCCVNLQSDSLDLLLECFEKNDLRIEVSQKSKTKITLIIKIIDVDDAETISTIIKSIIDITSDMSGVCCNLTQLNSDNYYACHNYTKTVRLMDSDKTLDYDFFKIFSDSGLFQNCYIRTCGHPIVFAGTDIDECVCRGAIMPMKMDNN